MPVQPKTNIRHNKIEHKINDIITDGTHTYKILKEVGRGGFAVVFEAVNVELQEHFAVKRFLLDSVDTEALGQIEAEIDLMKKLNHPNIVKYVDTIRTEGYLYVVLEFMENGSLQTILRKNGQFSESVAAIYIVQILRGLKYLHEQGVLHRDIKGANILTSLDGQVKLADFGVAMKLSDTPNEDEQFVVGTPYWMAPEIIEMSTPTPACDIWSVGCTVIELLTGKPPYFDLAPMAALFRIVQDDYPPLPDGISQALRDFLMLCFQKEPTMRKNADRLLEHPWLQNTSNAVVHTTDILPSKDGIPEDQVVVNTIRKFQLDMKSKPTKKNTTPQASSTTSASQKIKNQASNTNSTTTTPTSSTQNQYTTNNKSSQSNRVNSNNFESNSVPTTPSGKYDTISSFEFDSQQGTPKNSPSSGNDNNKNHNKPTNKIDKKYIEDDEIEVWDDNFDETVKLPLRDVKQNIHDKNQKNNQSNSSNSATTKIKLINNQPTSRTQSSNTTTTTSSSSTSTRNTDLKITNEQLTSIINDANWEDEMDAADTPNRVKQNKSHGRVDTHVNVSSLVPNLSKYQDTNDDADMADINFDDSLPTPPNNRNNNGNNNSSSNLNNLIQRNQNTLSSKESDKSSNSVKSNTGNMTRILNQRMKQHVTEENTDTFDDFEFDEHYFQQNETRDVHMRRSREIVQLMASIKPDSTEKDVIDKCNQLLQTFEKYPEQREHLITHHGVLPVLDMLEARSGLRPNIPVLDMLEARSGTIRPHVLRVINKIVEGSTRAQEQLSLVGLIPIVMRLLEYSPNKGRLGISEPEGVDPVVLEAGRFVHQISSTSSLTLQMLIGAGGLPILVHMISFSSQMSNYNNNNNNNTTNISKNLANDAKQMVYMGIDCIIEVFAVKSSRTRDFCKLFVKFGLLPHLSLAFQSILGINSINSNPLTSATANNSSSSTTTSTQSTSDKLDGNNIEIIRWQYGLKIANIIWILSRYEITEAIYKDGLLAVIIQSLNYLILNSSVYNSRLLFEYNEMMNTNNNNGNNNNNKINNMNNSQSNLNNLTNNNSNNNNNNSNNNNNNNLSNNSNNVVKEYNEIIEYLLKSIKNFTMEPTALNDLESIGTIGILINILSKSFNSNYKNHILPSLYNLCRIETRRLDLAAKEGIIPHLQSIIIENSYLKQFALPILFDIVRASNTSRDELWKHNGVEFYINLLNEKYWQTFALNSLTYWLNHDGRVEAVLVEPSNIAKLVDFFRNASTQTIGTVYSPLSKMLSKSPAIARALGSSGLFVLSIVNRLNTSEAIVLRSLLKILQCIHQNHPSPRQLVLDHNLYSIVKGLAQAEGQVVVNLIANKLLKDFQSSTLT